VFLPCHSLSQNERIVLHELNALPSAASFLVIGSMYTRSAAYYHDHMVTFTL
jgi:hypothetical protein